MDTEHTTLTVHTRSAAHAPPARHDRRAAPQRLARARDVEVDRAAIRAEVVEVARGLRVQRVVFGRWRAGLDDEDAWGGRGGGEAGGEDEASGAA